MAAAIGLLSLVLASASQPHLSANIPAVGIALAPVADIGSRWGVVTSTRRSVQHNRAVGGAANSYHLVGRAIDIARRPGVRHRDIDAAYRAAGYVLLESLDEGDHSHFAFGGIGSIPRVLLAAGGKSDDDGADQASCRAPTPEAGPIGRRRPDRQIMTCDASD